jgi:hypothetical protein
LPKGHPLVAEYEHSCPACGMTFIGDRRRIWCSNACRQRGFHMRRDWPDQAPIVFRRRLSPFVIVHRCPGCDAHHLGPAHCDACDTDCNPIGPGAPCPHCKRPVAVVEIMPDVPLL